MPAEFGYEWRLMERTAPGILYRRPVGKNAFFIEVKGTRGSIIKWGLPDQEFDKMMAKKDWFRASRESQLIQFGEDAVHIVDLEISSKLKEPLAEAIVSVRLFKFENQKLTVMRPRPFKIPSKQEVAQPK
jgi:hypothetical protein